MGLATEQVIPGDLVGASAFEVLGNIADFEQHLRSALGGDHCQFDASIGGRHFETWLVPVRNEDGAIRGATGMAADSSERKEMAAKLALSERLASVGSLASGICHEINNPLTYILTNIDVALESAQTAEAREALLEAKEGANRVRTIVGDLGTFSRPGKLKLVAVELVPVLEMAARMANSEIRHRARLVTDYQATPRVLADAGRLGQVLINLLLNAAQAITPGKIEENEIRISTRLGDQDRVIVEVCDTGCGIPAEALPRIFDPFFSTRQVEGTGLGLSIAKSLVEGIGGSIEVESRAVGTCFRILLATHSDAALAIAPPIAPKQVVPPAGALILVVDDDASVLRALCRILRGYELATATSGREAIELLAEQTFDLILCDLMMPDLTGMDVYRWLEGNHPGLEQRMLFITGGAFTEEQKDFLAQLSSDCLYKPIAPQQLLQAVQDRLTGS
jgi:signal transduction histidine kinase/CheY-like chemotaxis protein